MASTTFHIITLFFSSYDVDEILASSCEVFADLGWSCSTPLLPGIYGSLDPVSITVGVLPDIVGILLGTIRADVTIKTGDGEIWACIWIRMKVV